MSTSHPTPPAGSLFLVSGLAGGREVFVGKALDASFDEHLLLEGKLVHLAEGAVVVQPFATEVDFFLLDSSFTVQRVTTEHAVAEARQLLGLSVSRVSPASFPFLHRWFLATCRDDAETLELELDPSAAPGAVTNPLYGFYAGFLSTAEQFRRTLLHAAEITTSRELDKVAELEGDLVVEVGKLAAQAAVRFHRVVAQEPDLQAHLAAYDGAEVPTADTDPSRAAMGGFVHLLDRMTLAKSFARRSARAGVVRDINTLIKDAVFGLNELVLDHANSLDTLITETFAQYGLAYELFGELSPYAGYTGPAPTDFAKVELEPQALGSR